MQRTSLFVGNFADITVGIIALMRLMHGFDMLNFIYRTLLAAPLVLVLSNAASAQVDNCVEVIAASETDVDSTPNNGVTTEDDYDCATITPVALIDLELTKTVDNPTQSIGSNVNFTISLVNQGPSDATGVAVADLLPSGFSFVSSTPSVGTYDNASGVWTIGDFAATATASLVLEATVLASGDYTNTAQVSAANETDVDSTPNNDDGDQSEDDEDSASVVPGREPVRMI